MREQLYLTKLIGFKKFPGQFIELRIETPGGMEVAYVEGIVTQSQRRALASYSNPNSSLAVMLRPAFRSSQDPNLEFSLLQLTIR